jgi:hypothetical protein
MGGLRRTAALAMVRRMTKIGLSIAALGALAMALQACSAPPEKAAAEPVRSLLAAAQAGDAAAFEALLDRPAIRMDLRKQLTPVARANKVLVDGGPSEAALDRMIGPTAFRLVATETGARLAGAPSATQAQALLKRVDGRRVCIHDTTPRQACIATFAKEPAGWRLIGMLAGGVTVAVPAEPQK